MPAPENMSIERDSCERNKKTDRAGKVVLNHTDDEAAAPKAAEEAVAKEAVEAEKPVEAREAADAAQQPRVEDAAIEQSVAEAEERAKAQQHVLKSRETKASNGHSEEVLCAEAEQKQQAFGPFDSGGTVYQEGSCCGLATEKRPH